MMSKGVSMGLAAVLLVWCGGGWGDESAASLEMHNDGTLLSYQKDWIGETAYPEAKDAVGAAVLVYFVACGGSANYALPALENLGITNVTTVSDQTGFDTQMSSGGPWDLVIVDMYEYHIATSSYDLLVSYYDAGGAIIYSSWIYNDAPAAFTSRAGVVSSSRYQTPIPVYAWSAYPFFTTPNDVLLSSFIPGSGSCNYDGHYLSATTATAYGGYTGNPEASQAALTLDPNEQLLINGFTPGLFAGDADSDGKIDMVELYENEIAFFLIDACTAAYPADPLPPNGATNVSVDTNLAWTAAGRTVIEDFEDGDVSNYSIVHINSLESSFQATTTAAHDGSYGFADPAKGESWAVRTDAAVQISQGITISYWAKFSQGDPGRIYCGFGAGAGGTYSLVMAPNSSVFEIQHNPDYQFISLSSVAQTWEIEKWYRLEVEWAIGGQITGNLYDSDGLTLINSVNVTDNTITQGGIALRGFSYSSSGDSAFYIDTIERTGIASKSLWGSEQWSAPTPRDPAEAIGWDEDNQAWIFPAAATKEETGVMESKEFSYLGAALPYLTSQFEGETISSGFISKALNPGCGGTRIDFDDIPTGTTWATDRYAAFGVLFSGPGGQMLYANAETAPTHTPPNWIVTQEPTFQTIYIELLQPASCVSLYVHDADLEPGENFTIDVFNSANQLLERLQTNVDNQVYSFSYSDIWRVEFTPSTDREGLDTFEFVPDLGECNTTYDVYFGTTNPPTTLICNNTSQTVCDPGQLQANTTYYWQVFSTNCCGSWTGPVWSFTTEAQPNVVEYHSTNVPQPVTDYNVTISTLHIPDSGVIADLNLALNLTHTFTGDLRAYLESPQGTTVELFRYVGGGGDNFSGTVFDDEAGIPISSGAAPFTGRFRPSSLLSLFDGENANGTWTLVIYDDAGADQGSLTGWSLLIDYVDSSFDSTDVPKPLPDVATVSSTLTITEPVVVADIDVRMDVTHTYTADLYITLQSPAGTVVVLSNQRGGAGDNFTGTVFDDEAATAISAGTAPFNGRFRPDGSLASFDGQDAQGTWTLTIADLWGGDSGTLNSWGVDLAVLSATSAEKWVKFGFGGVENGSPSNPFNTVTEGRDAVTAGGTVNIYAGQSSEVPALDKAMTIRAIGGTVRLGAP